MSLYLPEQKLGSHSKEGASSQKFILKGRQTGGVHRGHTWVFRAESYDTMMAWYEDIKALTETPPHERTELMRSSSRSISRTSRRSMSSDAGVVDEEDEEPFAAGSQLGMNTAVNRQVAQERRPQAGGRFPSDLQVNAERGLQATVSQSTSSSGGGAGGRDGANSIIANGGIPTGGVVAAGALAGSGTDEPVYRQNGNGSYQYGATAQTPMEQAQSHAAKVNREAAQDGVNPYTGQPIDQLQTTSYGNLTMNPALGGFQHQGTSTPSQTGSLNYVGQTPSHLDVSTTTTEQVLVHSPQVHAARTQSPASQQITSAQTRPSQVSPLDSQGPETAVNEDLTMRHNLSNGAAPAADGSVASMAFLSVSVSAGNHGEEGKKVSEGRVEEITEASDDGPAERPSEAERSTMQGSYHVPGQFPRSNSNVNVTRNGVAT